MNLIKLFGDREIVIKIVDSNRYWSAQDCAKACGSSKTIRSWQHSDRTKEYLQALSDAKKNASNWVLASKERGDNGGTWIHEDAIVEFARWLSPQFAIWCDQQIKELLIEGSVVSDKMSNKKILQLERKLNKATLKVKALESSDRKTYYEAEVHKIFSFAYHLVCRPNLTAEYSYGGRKFDFFELRSDRIIITELKAVSIDYQLVRNELEDRKDYLKKAIEIANKDHRQRKVRVKFLAPTYIEFDQIASYLNRLKQTFGIEFELATYESELQGIAQKHLLKYGSVTKTDEEFGKIRGRLADIIQQRSVVIA